MKTLKPIYDHDAYSKPIEQALYSYFYQLIFAPLFALLKEPEQRSNANSSALEEALRSGKIIYSSPYFIGPLSAAISKELKRAGAVYNKQRKAFKLEQTSLPLSLLASISEGNRKAKQKAREVEDYLRAIEGRQLPKLNLENPFKETFDKLDKQFHSSTKPLTGEDLEIPLDESLRDQLSEAYSNNLDLYIKDWYDTQILKLRKKVSENVESGFRAENLIETIQAEKQVTYNKAKFLARQETSLMVSKYRQIRYEEVGIDKYIWSTSHDGRVRPDHRELQGKVFSFSNPPVTDHHTMARNNPGEDFNCRCVAIPVISDSYLLKKEMSHV